MVGDFRFMLAVVRIDFDSRTAMLTDEQWVHIELLLPSNQARKERNFVERHFTLAKQLRGIATKYGQLAITNRAIAILWRRRCLAYANKKHALKRQKIFREWAIMQC